MKQFLNDTLFVLTIYTYQEWRRRYPRYNISKSGTFYCHTLVEAEELLHQLILNKDGNGDLWLPDNVRHFTINEYPYGSSAHLITSRLYDSDGNLTDQSLCPWDGENGSFHGRPEEMIRFNHGDIVEMKWRDEIELGFVVNCPVDTKRADLINSDHPTYDTTDDSYTILTTSDYISHNHVYALDVFQPMFHIPKPTLNRLQKAYEKFVKDETQYVIDDYAGQWLILLPESIGWKIYSARWKKKSQPFKCQFVYPHALTHILQRPITLCRDNRSFIDTDDVRKMAFVVEDIAQVPNECRKEYVRIERVKI